VSHELLTTPTILAQPELELTQLTLAGVAFGAPAAQLPRARIVEAQRAPHVASFRAIDLRTCGPDGDGEARGARREGLEYFATDGSSLALERVIDDVLREGGTLHLTDEAGLRVWGGRITRFSLYGRSLRAFAALRSEHDMLERFGPPDRLLLLEADGDLMAHDAYYARSRKWLRWDHRNRRLAVVTLGGSAFDLRAGRYGGIVRHECALPARVDTARAPEDALVFRDRAGRTLSEAELRESTDVRWELVGALGVPAQARMLHQQGRLAGGRGDSSQALRLFEAAHALAPNWPYPCYDAAFTHLLANDRERALVLYSDVDLLAPRGFFAAKTTLHLLGRELQGELPPGTTRMLLLLEWQCDSDREQLLGQLLSRHPDLGPAWMACVNRARTAAARAYAVECGLKARCDAETQGLLQINRALDLCQRGEQQAGFALLARVALDPDTTLGQRGIGQAQLASGRGPGWVTLIARGVTVAVEAES